METGGSANIEKVKIYITIEPLSLKFGAVFKKSETFLSIINFVVNQIKKMGIKFELGRIIENKTGAILLTDNLIGDFLETNDEVTVFSEEFGFTRTNIVSENNATKKIYYNKNVSDLYKSNNFLKKKRNEKNKNKKLGNKKDEGSDNHEEKSKQKENKNENKKDKKEDDSKEKKGEKSSKKEKKEIEKKETEKKNEKENKDKKRKEKASDEDDSDED